jgi:hypothetical protein
MLIGLGSLSKEIETLHWVLAKILTLKRGYTTLLEATGMNQRR